MVACYARGANAFVAKPHELDEFMDLISAIRSFWLETRSYRRLSMAGT